MIRQSIEVELLGGLGNQLFGFAAGLNLKQRLDLPLKLNVGRIGLNGSYHGKSILGIGLDDIEVIDQPRRIWVEDRVRHFIEITKPLKSFSQLSELSGNTYLAKDLGFEIQFNKISHPVKLKRYFQSYRYVDPIKENMLSRIHMAKGKTDKYEVMKSRILSENPTIIHIRRGDYLEPQNMFGTLSTRHFVNCLDYFKVRPVHDPAWIFTDSPELLSQEIKGTELKKWRPLIYSGELSAIESMLLISQAKKILISNSSFSWWAAYLSNGKAEIVAPKKWFRDRNDPTDVLPITWHQIESIWN